MSEEQITYTKNQTIFRTMKNQDNPFVMMDRRPIENPTLSWKAKGILAYLLSRPDNWTVRIGDLVKRSTDKAFAIRAAIKELSDAGHLSRRAERDEQGRFLRYVLEVYELPFTGQPLRGFPQADNPQAGNLSLNNTDSNDTDKRLGANAPAPSKHDSMETLLGFERLKQERAAQSGLPVEVLTAVESYPADCQHGARLIFQRHKLTPPAKPKSGKGGDYADWINGLREIAKLCAEYKVTLETGFDEFFKAWNPSSFIFDRPAAMTKTMRSALARHALRAGANESTPEPEPERHPVPRPANILKPTIGKPSLRPHVS